MDQEQAREFVIRQLGRHNPKNDIITYLCEQGGMNWSEAEKFVKEVEFENSSEIALKQSPLIVLLGSIILLGGILLSGTIFIMTIQGYVIFLLKLPIPYLGNIVYFVIGIAMIVGGLRGMWDTLQRIWIN